MVSSSRKSMWITVLKKSINFARKKFKDSASQMNCKSRPLKILDFRSKRLRLKIWKKSSLSKLWRPKKSKRQHWEFRKSLTEHLTYFWMKSLKSIKISLMISILPNNLSFTSNMIRTNWWILCKKRESFRRMVIRFARRRSCMSNKHSYF